MKYLSLFVLLFSSMLWTVAQDDTEILVTDGVQHSVPLETIIFDDFDSLTRALPYPQRLKPILNACETVFAHSVMATLRHV